HLSAPQGAVTGSGELIEMSQFKFSGHVANVRIEQFLAGYSGVIGGPLQAEGDIHNLKSTLARGNLAIAPTGGAGLQPARRGRLKPATTSGVPVSGRLNADYNGKTQMVALSKSYVQLPHTRIDLSGNLGREIDV